MARNHHFIPRFHLRRFSHDYPRRFVLAYDKRTQDIGRISVARTAFRRDYYTIETRGRAPDEFERWLAGVEHDASIAIGDLLHLPQGRLHIPIDTKRAVALHVGLLRTRVPAERRQIEELAEAVGNLARDLTVQHPEGFAKALKGTGWTGTDDDAEVLRSTRQAELNAGIGALPGRPRLTA